MPVLRVPSEEFPELDAYTEKIFLKYRVISEDKNRTSYWSPLFEIDPEIIFVPGTLTLPGSIVGTKNTGYITLAWDEANIYGTAENEFNLLRKVEHYDLWIQYTGNGGNNAGPWIHKERIPTTSVNVLIPPTYQYLDSNGVVQSATTRQAKIEVHRPARPIIRYSTDRIIFNQTSNYVDTSNGIITFEENPDLETGEPVSYYVYNAASAIGGLSDGTTYWVKMITQNKMSLHTSESGAINDTGRVSLTSPGQGFGVIVKKPFLQSSSIDTTNERITLPFPHFFKTGDAVIYNALVAAAPLVKETLYFVRVLDANTVSLHLTRAAALNNASPINLTNTGSGYATMPKFPSLLYKTSVTSL
jgi:hypothetical protein